AREELVHCVIAVCNRALYGVSWPAGAVAEQQLRVMIDALPIHRADHSRECATPGWPPSQPWGALAQAASIRQPSLRRLAARPAVRRLRTSPDRQRRTSSDACRLAARSTP